MNRQVALIAIAITVVLATLAAWIFRSSDGASETPGGSIVVPETSLETAPEATWTARLYFPGEGGRLYPEERELPRGDDPSERIGTLVSALLAGPEQPATRAPLPDGVSVRKVYLVDGTTVYLDLSSQDGAPPPASGSWREMQTVYSLVNTVLLNVTEARQMVLLWNGRQLQTFAGHLDTMRPLEPQTSLIARAP